MINYSFFIVKFFYLLKDHLLAIIAFLITLFFFFFYRYQKKKMGTLSDRYEKNFLKSTGLLVKDFKPEEFSLGPFHNFYHHEKLIVLKALARYFRDTGEIEKVVPLHQYIIASKDISETMKLTSLRELALTYHKAGLMDRAIETYQDYLRLGPDDPEILKNLAALYEDLEDWDSSFNVRKTFAFTHQENQSNNLAHLLAQKAEKMIEQGQYSKASDLIDEGLSFAPVIYLKILQIKIFLIKNLLDMAKDTLKELLNEDSANYLLIVRVLFHQNFNKQKFPKSYYPLLETLKIFFLDFPLKQSYFPIALIEAKLALLHELKDIERIVQLLRNYSLKNIKISKFFFYYWAMANIEEKKKDLLSHSIFDIISKWDQIPLMGTCKKCGFKSDDVFWRCLQCHSWDSIDYSREIL